MVQPLAKPKRVKKFGLKKFNRHQHDRKIAVKVGNCSLSVGGQELALLYSLSFWKAPRYPENGSLTLIVKHAQSIGRSMQTMMSLLNRKE